MAAGKTTKRIQFSIEAIAALMLLVMLTMLTMLLISSTGRSYQNIARSGSASQEVRTGLFFITTKVRKNDAGGNINVVKTPFGGDALVISQSSGGVINEDWIFYYKGTLREALVPKGTEINPPACAVISRLSSLTFQKSGSKILITASKDASGSGAGSAICQNLTLTLRT